jgi:hypothetical protein
MGIKNFYTATELAWEMRDEKYGVDHRYSRTLCRNEKRGRCDKK